jgi:hypothetical protein
LSLDNYKTHRLTPPLDQHAIGPITIHSVIHGHDPVRALSAGFFLSTADHAAGRRFQAQCATLAEAAGIVSPRA